MTKVNIFIDPSSPIHKNLEKEILGYVESLQSISYQRVTMPSQPGKLSGADSDTIKLIVELSTSVIEFISAIMLISAQVSASQSRKRENDKKKPIEIEVEGIKISLPVKEETARKHIRSIKIKLGDGSSTNPTRKKQAVKKSLKK